MIVLAVAAAGVAGTLLRYGVDVALRRRRPRWPTGPILLVNVSGSLLLGLLTGLVAVHSAPHAVLAVAGTGFCGSYTTFSTSVMETLALARRRRFAAAAAHAGSTLIASTLAAAAGLLLAML